MIDLNFAHPQYLTSLVLLIPAVVALWYLGFRLRQQSRRAYGEEKLVNRFTRPLTMVSEIALVGAWLTAVTLLVVAAAGPITRSLPINVQAGTLQVIAVVDVSKSMGAEDYRSAMPPKDGYEPDLVPGPYGSRLDYVKHTLTSQVMPSITGNQLGVVTYSGNGFEQVPLTDDWTASRWVMKNWMVVGNAPGGGSDYAEGLSMALNMFERDEIDGRQKVVLLFTDGGFTGDEQALADALARAKEMDVRLIIVGVGSKSPSPIPVYSDEGQLEGYREQDGNVVVTSVDDGALRALQAQSGGEYILLDPNGDGNLNITWAATLGGNKAETRQDPVFQYPLGLAMVIVLGLFLRGVLPSRNANVRGRDLNKA